MCSRRSRNDTYWKNTFIPSPNPVNRSIFLLALSLVGEPSFLFVLLRCFVLYSLMWFCYCKSFSNCQVEWMGPRSLHQRVSLPELTASAWVFLAFWDSTQGDSFLSFYLFRRCRCRWSWIFVLTLKSLFNFTCALQSCVFFFFHMHIFSLVILYKSTTNWG